jgi:hypothetical protein
MRYITAFWLFSAVVKCLPQFNPLMSLVPPELPMGASKQLKPIYRSTAKRSITTYGPIRLFGLDVSSISMSFALEHSAKLTQYLGGEAARQGTRNGQKEPIWPSYDYQGLV